jgi:hypothetical protein
MLLSVSIVNMLFLLPRVLRGGHIHRSGRGKHQVNRTGLCSYAKIEADCQHGSFLIKQRQKRGYRFLEGRQNTTGGEVVRAVRPRACEAVLLSESMLIMLFLLPRVRRGGHIDRSDRAETSRQS